jgi:serine protease Do
MILTDRDKALAQLSRSINGLKLSVITPEIRQKLGLGNIGIVIIIDIELNSKAAQEGFQVGDVIIQIENKQISNIDEVRMALGASGKKRIYLNRHGIIGMLIIS